MIRRSGLALAALALTWPLTWAPAAAEPREADPAGTAHPPEHAQLHRDFYSTLERPDMPQGAHPWQRSCCSNRDYRPVRARFRQGHWEFATATGWRRVPPGKLLGVRAPDRRAHVCISARSDEVLCFVKPGFGT